VLRIKEPSGARGTLLFGNDFYGAYRWVVCSWSEVDLDFALARPDLVFLSLFTSYNQIYLRNAVFPSSPKLFDKNPAVVHSPPR
jgi:hypothetical protein